MSERPRAAPRPLLGRLLAGWLLLGPAWAPAAAPDPVPPGRWSVAWEEQHCSLSTASADAPAALFVLRTIPGNRFWEMRLAGGARARGVRRDLGRLRISLQPSGLVLPGRPYLRHSEAGDALVMSLLPASLLDTIAESRSARVERNGETVLEFPFAEMQQAIADVRQCEIRVLREWGIDPVAYAAVRVPAIWNAAPVVTDDDYPPAALRARASGLVVVRMTIDAHGRVSECVPVVSSGHAMLDSRTCAIFRERLRFTPAIGPDGAPAPAAVVTTLNWVLPR